MYNFEFVKLSVLGQEPGTKENEVVLDFQIDIKQKLVRRRWGLGPGATKRAPGWTGLEWDALA